MRCPECGAKIRDGAAFCAQCGCEVKENKLSAKERKRIIVLISVFAVTLVVLSAIVLLVSNRPDNVDDITAEDQQPGTYSSETAGETGNDLTGQDENTGDESDASDMLDRFGLSADSVTDYASLQTLDYTQYTRYESGIAGFNFSYPSSLFNSVTVANDEVDENYGPVLEQVDMSGTDGSHARFAVYRNNITGLDTVNMENMTEYVFSHEKELVCAPNVLVNGASDALDHGTVLLTGYTDPTAEAFIMYDLCRVDNEYIYRMQLIYPKPADNEDDRHKAYYTQMMYCLCDYSGAVSAKPVAYNDFVIKQYDQFTLNDYQKDCLRKVVEYMIDPMTNGPQFGYEHDFLYGSETEMPLGSTSEIAGQLSDDVQLLQMLQTLYPRWDDIDVDSEYAAIIYDESGRSKEVRKSDVSADEFRIAWGHSYGYKDALYGAWDHAKVYFRDMFEMELNPENIEKDYDSREASDVYVLAYNQELDEIVYVCGLAEGPDIYDGPDELIYNEERGCFQYTYGPVYYIYDETWQDCCDRGDPGHGIYRFYIEPFLNNSLGFKLLGIERIE